MVLLRRDAEEPNVQIKLFDLKQAIEAMIDDQGDKKIFHGVILQMKNRGLIEFDRDWNVKFGKNGQRQQFRLCSGKLAI